VSDNRLDIFRYTPPYGSEDMQREIDILRAALAKSNAERDEARRIVCSLEADTTEDQREYAKQRGWDCFGPNMCKEAQHDLEADTHPG
jgi:hypothetical protein